MLKGKQKTLSAYCLRKIQDESSIEQSNLNFFNIEGVEVWPRVYLNLER